MASSSGSLVYKRASVSPEPRLQDGREPDPRLQEGRERQHDISEGPSSSLIDLSHPSFRQIDTHQHNNNYAFCTQSLVARFIRVSYVAAKESYPTCSRF